MQESNFASSSSGRISASVMQLTCACTACMEWQRRLKAWHLNSLALSRLPFTTGSTVSKILKTTLLCGKAPIKAGTWKGRAGADAVSKAQQIKGFGWHWPAAGGTVGRRSRDARHLCTMRAVCDYTGRRQRRYGPIVIVETCWEESMLLGIPLFGWGAELPHGESSAAFQGFELWCGIRGGA